MFMQIKPRLTVDDYLKGVLGNDRIILGQAITLVESNLATDEMLAGKLMEKILRHTGKSIRIGITGVPGVGKSTFIEAFGNQVIEAGKKLAVLTVDPSSPLTKGSILGDKTRMEDLSKNPKAFIRPSPAGNSLGGVANKTREALLICEAAGYEIIIVETVGVGQSEVAVKNMVDFFLLLALAGAGDELQGIKKGIMEMADAVVITKADGDNLNHAIEAQAEYQHALHLTSSSESGWVPKVLTSSAMTGQGIDQVWKMINNYRDSMTSKGFFEAQRNRQQVAWFREYFHLLLNADLLKDPSMVSKQNELEQRIANLELSPYAAAQNLLKEYRQSVRANNS
jgi:LAO/AO transport system kinase